MSGQPNIPVWIQFDVTNLEVSADPSLPPSNIVKQDETFDLSATFEAGGVIWTWLELLSDLPGVDVVGKVVFSAEGIGPHADEEDLGPAEVILSPGGSPYTVTTTVPANQLDEGVYTLASYVTFEVRSGGGAVPLPGVTGHYSGLGTDRQDLSVYVH
jgi:hypothetical protein